MVEKAIKGQRSAHVFHDSRRSSLEYEAKEN